MNEIVENVKIIGQDHKGRGIAKIEDKITFIEHVLPNEICDIKMVKETKKYNEAKVIEWKKSVHEKVLCPYFENCGGCDILHQKYEEQLKFKEQKVKEILEKFAKVKIPLNPIIYEDPYFYRNKIILHNLGLYKKKSNCVIPIKKCMLVDERINQMITMLQEYSKNSNDIIEEAKIRVSSEGEILLDITGKIQAKKLHNLFEHVDVLIINKKFITEKKTIIDKIHGMQFKISSASFYQVNRFVTSKLYDKVLEIYKDTKMETVLDLYCGTGTISLLVAPFVKKVIGIEVIKEAVEDANENKKLNDIKNVEFICGKVEDYIETFENIDAIIVDPPRTGLDNKTLHTILKIKPKYITYVSCDPVTLARDINVLKEDYNILEVTPVDMFPNTYHVECVSVLNRR